MIVPAVADAALVIDRQARAYPPLWRLVAAGLLIWSGASLPIILALVVVATDPPVTLPVLVRLVLICALLPFLAARLIMRACAVTLELGDLTVAIDGRGLRLEIPFRSIDRIAPWTVPMPGCGVTLWMRSGRRLRNGLEPSDLGSLLEALADAGVDVAAAAIRHPTAVYARAKHDLPAWRWYHLLVKFPLFALLPTAVLFNAHQYIAYGGPLGQYYLLGLTAFLTTFAGYWITTTIYLVLYASLWRGLVEGAALLGAWLAPARAPGVRRLTEGACRALYYGGVPALLAWRFLA